jgi:hypothetical protein
MALDNIAPIIKYVYSGPGTYSFPFTVYRVTDIQVAYLDGTGSYALLSANTDYTVNVDDDDIILGTVTTINPLTSGGYIYIQRILPLVQDVDWVNNDRLDVQQIEDSFDRVTMMLQQMQYAVDGSLTATNWRGLWMAGSAYFSGQIVIDPITNDLWDCYVGHTSGVFADDIDAGYWHLVLDISSAVDNATDTYKVKRDGITDDPVYVGTLLDGIYDTISSVNTKITNLSSVYRTAAQVNTAVLTLLPRGTGVIFCQAAAPVGWTKSVAAHDYMLRLVTGVGGLVGGIHSPILMDVVPAHTHTAWSGNQSADHDHDLYTGGQSNSHTHTYLRSSFAGSWGAGPFGALANSEYGASSDGVSYDHSHTGRTYGVRANHTHDVGMDGGSSSTNWQPKYAGVILCYKD